LQLYNCYFPSTFSSLRKRNDAEGLVNTLNTLGAILSRQGQHFKSLKGTERRQASIFPKSKFVISSPGDVMPSGQRVRPWRSPFRSGPPLSEISTSEVAAIYASAPRTRINFILQFGAERRVTLSVKDLIIRDRTRPVHFFSGATNDQVPQRCGVSIASLGTSCTMPVALLFQ
jgi:hypothetical protein